MSAAPALCIEILQEQSEILSRLEELTLHYELGLESGSAATAVETKDAGNETGPSAERSRLLGSLQEVSTRLESLGRKDPESAELWTANRRRAQDLFRRTSDLLAGWRTRREEFIASMDRLRGGRRALDAYRPGTGEASSVNLRR